MACDPERYDDLALRHVLGALATGESGEFRRHLVGCSECRRRVAELRGIADDLVAVEREERATMASLQTKLAPVEVGLEEDFGEAPSRSERLLGIIIGVGSLVVVALLLWNFSLRDHKSLLTIDVLRQRATMELLATGDDVPATVAPGVSARVTQVEDDFAVTMAGLDFTSARVMVIWTHDPARDVWVFRSGIRGRTLEQDGVFATSGPTRGGDRLLVTSEASPFDVQSSPGTNILLEAIFLAESTPAVPLVTPSPSASDGG